MTATVRVGVRQRPQQDRIHHTEDGRVCPDAERQRQYRHSREAGILAEYPKTVAQVLQYVFEPSPFPHVTTLLSQHKVVAESPLRRIARFFRRHARFHLLLLTQFAVQAHLFFQVSVELLGMKQLPESSSKFAEPTHTDHPSGSLNCPSNGSNHPFKLGDLNLELFSAESCKAVVTRSAIS